MRECRTSSVTKNAMALAAPFEEIGDEPGHIVSLLPPRRAPRGSWQRVGGDHRGPVRRGRGDQLRGRSKRHAVDFQRPAGAKQRTLTDGAGRLGGTRYDTPVPP